MQVDDVVGGVLDALEQAQMTGDTLVLFSSDNGPVWYDKDVKRFGHDSAGPLRGMKGDAWEGGHRMPFIVRWPNRVASGSVSDYVVCFSDVLATFSDILDLQQVGEDSVSFLAGDDRPAVRSREGSATNCPRPKYDSRWKVEADYPPWIGWIREPRNVKPPEGSKLVGQLYDLREDLAEQNNVYLEHPNVVRRLRRQLAELTKK